MMSLLLVLAQAVARRAQAAEFELLGEPFQWPLPQPALALAQQWRLGLWLGLRQKLAQAVSTGLPIERVQLAAG